MGSPRFISPWVAMAGGFREQAMVQEEERRKRQAEALAEREMKIREQRDMREAAEAKMQEAAARLAIEEKERQAAKAAVESAGVGGPLAGMDAERARRLTPSMVSVTGEDRMKAKTLPVTTTPGLLPEGMESGPIAPAWTLPGEQAKVTSKGTRRQQLMEALRTNPNMEDRELMLMLLDASGDDNIPASAAEMLSTADQSTRLFRRNNKGGMEESVAGKGWVEHLGPLPEKFRIVNEPSEDSMTPNTGGNQTPYFIPVTTGTGIVPFNARTGQFIDADRKDLKPGETAQREISNAITVGQTMDRIAKDFTPEKVGALQGRLSNLDQKYWGSDPEYAALFGSIRTLQNTVIQLRTGAQMSVQEAQRIMDELPNEKTPASTFVAKLNRARDFYNQWLKNRASVAYGRTTPDDITKITTEGFGPADPLPTGTAGPGAAKPPTPRKNPFRK